MTEQHLLAETVENTLRHLRQGHTILYPTDTIWGIGCDATCSNAIERLYAVKRRDHSKSMLILCTDAAMVRRYVPTATDTMLQQATEGDRPTTVIFPHAEGLPNNLLAADGSIGIRIPRHDLCQQLLRGLGHPIVSTSANLSGHPSPTLYDDIETALKEHIDYCVPPLPLFDYATHVESRIVKLEADGTVTIIRP